ncbi:hypothetical protein B0J14DRAFT_491364 [Halenospora varia]|nr:hypothetical protein B0J14DRAFT_491364 [Halenospora varia]
MTKLRFHALSYAWGDAILSHEMSLDGQILKITASLFAPLRAIQRSPKETTIYAWADAICINQQNLEERSM